VFVEVLIAEEVDGVRDKVSGNTTTIDVWTLLEASLQHVPEIYLLH
jgi:hypothetical protein